MHPKRLLARAGAGDALYQSGLSLNASLDCRQVLDTALALALDFSPAALSGRIYLLDGGALVFGGGRWAGNGAEHAGVAPPPDETAYQAARQAQVVVKNRSGSAGVAAAWPLRVDHGVVGVMALYYPRPAGPDIERVRLMQLLADQAGLAIQNARRFEMVSRQAFTDALTGLPNRRAFDDRLESETRRSSRYQHPFTLMMLDLDGFKGVNDVHGHPAGDEVLQQVAARLRQSLRDTDFFARYGGDEFAVILPETDRETATNMAGRLKEVLETCTFTLTGNSLS